MKKKLTLLLILTFISTLISCNKLQEETQNNNDAPKLPQTSNNSDKEKTNDKNKEEITSFSIYTVDVNTENLQLKSTLTLNGAPSIEESLKEIAKSTSSLNFNSLPIEFVKIETIDGKAIATIDLKEKEENKGKFAENIKGSNWLYGFFQGSTGGMITSTILTQNFLQKEYKGQWIDGVKFTCNGKSIDSQHAEELSKIIYR